MTYPTTDADIETPAEDAAEQHTQAYPDRDRDEDGPGDTRRGVEAPDWNAQEERSVGDSDDDYR